VPPFTGIAVKVTFVPGQMDPEGLADMLTDGVTVGLTVIVTVLDVAGLPDTQEALLVIWQIIWSELMRALLEYTALFVPTLLPFFFH
jgi:hypothetical protein